RRLAVHARLLAFDPALEIEEQRLQIERFVEVVRQELQVEHARVQIALAGRADEGSNDRLEHVLAKRALGLLALAHQLRVEASVRLDRLAAIEEFRGLEAEDGERERREQSPQRLDQDP